MTSLPITSFTRVSLVESESTFKEIPAAPGTTPIKPGNIRLYHQTTPANLKQIEDEGGIFLKHARGIEGPKAIYADEYGFYGDPDKRPSVEFQVPGDKWRVPFVLRDVYPEDIIAFHYPWHARARYIESEPDLLEEVLAGEHDGVEGYETAIAYLKRKYGKYGKY